MRTMSFRVRAALAFRTSFAATTASVCARACVVLALGLVGATPSLAGPKVDVVVLDITLPGQSGIELLKHLRSERPELAILVLSMHPERSFAVRLMRAGADGYVPKMIVPEELVRAVRAVGTGRRYITPIVAELLASDCASDDAGPLHNRLSERELQVFTRIARGISPAVMANELGLSVKTVSTYRARILEKMAMRSNAEIAAYAVRNQLVD